MWTSNGRYRLLSGVHVESKTTLLQKYNKYEYNNWCTIYHSTNNNRWTMKKVKEKYSAEIIILLIISLMLITSCKSKKQEPVKCCDKETAHALWNCGKSIEYKHSELITN